MVQEAKLSGEVAARFVLGLSPGCNTEDVKRAFRRLALIFHPDKNPGDDCEQAKTRFQAIVRAKEFLLNHLASECKPATPPTVRREPPRKAQTANFCSTYTKPEPAEPAVGRDTAVWSCSACQMRDIGSNTVPCARATAATRCFCGHPFHMHEMSGGKMRCTCNGCLCSQFTYIPPGAMCTCGHSAAEHDAVPFHACEAAGCNCQTFHHAGMCVCGHSWACHRTEFRKAAYSASKKPSAFWSTKADVDSSSRSRSSSPETSPTPSRQRPAKWRI